MGRRLTLVLSAAPVGCAIGAALWLALGGAGPGSPFEAGSPGSGPAPPIVRPLLKLVEAAPALSRRIATYFGPPDAPLPAVSGRAEDGMSIRLMPAPAPKASPARRDP